MSWSLVTKLNIMNENKKVIWSSTDEPKDNPKLRQNLWMVAIFLMLLKILITLLK
jgi:hypothetical protein